MIDYEIKTGDSLCFSVKTTEGIIDKLKCQLRRKNKELIADFIITESGEAGNYIFRLPPAITLPLGVCIFDIQYTDGDYVASTRTVNIKVIEDVTE